MSATELQSLLAATSYFIAATLFLLGLQRMASPRTARSGIRWAGAGMLVATAATFLLPELHNLGLIVTALVIGTVAAWVSGKKVAITDMPQMVALYNGMGGGAAAAIGAVELLRASSSAYAVPGMAGGGAAPLSSFTLTLAVLGAAIGAVSLSGSVIAWAKLDGRLDRSFRDPGQFSKLLDLEIRRQGWEENIGVHRLMNDWESLVGEKIAAHTTPVKYDEKSKFLHVQCDSTPWATQLRLIQATILKTIAEQLGPDVVVQLKVHNPNVGPKQQGRLRVQGRGKRDDYG